MMYSIRVQKWIGLLSLIAAIIILALTAPMSVESADLLQGASLVRIIETSTWSSPSTDPSGIVWLPSRGHLLISDSEIDQPPRPFWNGANLFETTTAGNLVNTYTTFTSNPTSLTWNNFTSEPAGVTVNPDNNHLFFSDDGEQMIFEVNPGADEQFNTSDDIVTSIDTTTFGDNDPEDIAFWQNTLYVSDGTGSRIYVINPGVNGIFDGVPPTGDDTITSFDTKILGVPDPEGIGINTDAGTLFLLGPASGNAMVEATLGGTLVRKIDISFINPIWVAGVTYAPSSVNPALNNVYIADRVIDNGADPNENDGRVYEIHIEDAPPSNLLANPGFEFDTNHDIKPDAWTNNDRFTQSTDLVQNGSFSGKHFATDNSGYTVKGTAYNLSAGATYAASARVNIPPTSDTFTFKLDVNWRNASDNSIGITTIKTYTAATSGWNEATASLVAPSGAVSAHLRMVVSSLNTTVYVDDMIFKPVTGSMPTPTATNTPTNTLTNTPTNTPTAANTPTSTATNTPINTPTETATPTATDTPTNTPTATDTPINTPTETPTPTVTDTPINTPTNTPTDTPVVPTNTPTNTPTSVPSGNLLLNPGFELDANNNGRPDNWGNNARFTRSSEMALAGSFAGKHFDTTNSNYNINQTVNNLSAGATYHMNGWVNIPATSDSFSFKIQVRWQSPTNSNLRTDTIATYTAATNGWVQAIGTRVAPAGATHALVRMQITNLNATIFTDEFSFGP